MESPINILIIDDEEVICKTLELILQKDGYNTTCAFNGLDAIELLKINFYDLVFVDLAMPQMNGTEVIQWVKKEKTKIKIVAMSGMDWKDTLLQGALNIGADRILRKPFQVVDVQKSVNSLGF